MQRSQHTRHSAGGNWRQLWMVMDRHRRGGVDGRKEFAAIMDLVTETPLLIQLQSSY